MITVDFESVSWRKSTYSGAEGGDCVELADLTSAWRKSTYSGSEGGQCVELADLTAAVGIRDSKNPYGPKLVVSRPELSTLITHIKSGHLDL